MEELSGHSEVALEDLPYDAVALILKQAVEMSGALQLSRVCKMFNKQIKSNRMIHLEALTAKREMDRLERRLQNATERMAAMRFHTGRFANKLGNDADHDFELWSCCETITLGYITIYSGSIDDDFGSYGCTLKPEYSTKELTEVREEIHRLKLQIERNALKCSQCDRTGHTHLNCWERSCVVCDRLFCWNGCFDNYCCDLQCCQCHYYGHKTVNCVSVNCTCCRSFFIDGHDVEKCNADAAANTCSACLQIGHWVSNCPDLPCRRCWSVNHVAAQCPPTPRELRQQKQLEAKQKQLEAKQEREKRKEAAKQERLERQRQKGEAKSTTKNQRKQKTVARNPLPSTPLPSVPLPSAPLPLAPPSIDKALAKFWEAAHSGSTTKLVAFLDAGIDVNVCNKAGKTALMIASERGHEELVRVLLQRGADPALCARRGKTALDLASSEVIITLLSLPSSPAPAAPESPE